MFTRGSRVGLVALIGVLAGPAYAQDDSIEELRRMVDQLNERINQLERERAEEQKSEAEQTVEDTEPVAEKERPKGALDVYWKEGLRFDSAYENENGVKPVQLKIGGRIHNDYGWFWFDDELESVGDAENGTEFRRARLYIEGTIYEDYAFKVQYDFAGDGSGDFKDVWLAANNIPFVGQLKIGQFHEPASLEELTSSNYITFMERAQPNVFAPSRSTGFQISNAYFEDRMTSAVGVFRDTNAFGDGFGDEAWAVTGRVTGLPWYREEGRKLIHLGTWVSWRAEDDSSFQVRQRPEAHIPDRFITTFDQIGAVDSETRWGFEGALVYGPFSAQGEFFLQRLDREMASDTVFTGWYVYASYFITGEHRPYKTNGGVFDKVKPKKNFQIRNFEGPGAWELALRYSQLDLDDEDVNGGEQRILTAGVNWYLNPNIRLMMNYVHANIEREEEVIVDAGTPDEEVFMPIDGDFNGIMSRFQVFF